LKEEIAIEVKGITKKYRIGLREKMYDSLAERISSILKYPLNMYSKLRSLSSVSGEGEDIMYALNEITFKVKKGEVLGVIGKNGAGKSTLLKILSKVTFPNSGCFKINGRVASLLEVGTGFHPELTGRENVYLNGTILGMKKREIAKKFDEIVSFSGVAKYIDTPVKRYSSGMRVRLAFAVAAHLEPEVLIIDEVLAVGDMEFQKKCLGKMNDIAREGRTVLFVSHNMGSVIELCDRAIMLENGKITKEGDPATIVSAYLQNEEIKANPIVLNAKLEAPFSITKVGVKGSKDSYLNCYDLKDDIFIEVNLKVNQPLEEFRLNLMLYKGPELLFHSRPSDNNPQVRFAPGLYLFSLCMPAMSLISDRYYVTIVATYMGGKAGPPTREHFENVLSFDIEERSFSTEYFGFAKKRGGKIICPGKWKMNAE